jgi:hypothetical protein
VGGQIATADGRLFDASGKLYAHASTTCLIFTPPRSMRSPTRRLGRRIYKIFVLPCGRMQPIAFEVAGNRSRMKTNKDLRRPYRYPTHSNEEAQCLQ